MNNEFIYSCPWEAQRCYEKFRHLLTKGLPQAAQVNAKGHQSSEELFCNNLLVKLTMHFLSFCGRPEACPSGWELILVQRVYCRVGSALNYYFRNGQVARNVPVAPCRMRITRGSICLLWEFSGIVEQVEIRKSLHPSRCPMNVVYDYQVNVR
jgi:hypothetical protein